MSLFRNDLFSAISMGAFAAVSVVLIWNDYGLTMLQQLILPYKERSQA